MAEGIAAISPTFRPRSLSSCIWPKLTLFLSRSPLDQTMEYGKEANSSSIMMEDRTFSAISAPTGMVERMVCLRCPGPRVVSVVDSVFSSWPGLAGVPGPAACGVEDGAEESSA